MNDYLVSGEVDLICCNSLIRCSYEWTNGELKHVGVLDGIVLQTTVKWMQVCLNVIADVLLLRENFISKLTTTCTSVYYS